MTGEKDAADFCAENAQKAAPAAMPSEREISGIIIDGMDDLRVDIYFDIDNKEQVADWAAAKIAALFAPILAEKERATVKRISDVASAVAAQAGVGASETAGLIVSVLAANPEQTERFMAEGSELFIDGTIRPENGCLTHMAMNGQVVSPTKLRMMKGQSQ